MNSHFQLSLTVLLLCCQPCFANTQATCEESETCVEQNSWQIGVAFGIGGRTNPLVDGDTIPFIILPDVAYYGENFYFDNAEIGFQFFPTRSTSVEWFIAPNAEKANFSFWHPANILVPAASFSQGDVSTPVVGDPVPESSTISIDNIRTRKWAIDSGLRWQWHHKNHHIQIKIATDISNVHEGQHASLSYRLGAQFNNWNVSISPQVRWVSDKLTNYYYGVSAADIENPNKYYTADGGLQYGLDVNALYAIDEHWRVLAKVGVLSLHDGMTNSPIVEDDFIYSAFVGVAYRF